MKKTLLLAMIGITIATLCSCGSKTIKGENGTEYENYREACRDGDFIVAHKFLDRLKEESKDGESKQKAMDAEAYIYRQEALFLMSQNDDVAKNRLIYLIKEEERGNELVEMIIDLAVEENDSSFVKILANQLTRRVSDDCLQKVGVFLLSSGNQEYIDFAFSLFEKLQNENLLLALANKYLMVGKDDVKLADKLLSILESTECTIPAKPKVGRFWTEENEYKYHVCEPYTNAVKKYNDQCLMFLNLAIKGKNQTFAKTLLGKVKSNINCIKEESTWDHRYRYNITIDNEDVKSANAAYQDAVRSGAFK